MIFIGVTGSRSWDDEVHVRSVLENHTFGERRFGLVVGDCPTGVDRIAREYGQDVGCRIEVMMADWENQGKAAGPMRNQAIVDRLRGRAGSYLLAFPGPESRGTWDTINRARKAGLATTIYHPREEL